MAEPVPAKPAFKIEEVVPGIYSVLDAYDGVYEYFPGKPLFRVENGEIVERFV